MRLRQMGAAFVLVSAGAALNQASLPFLGPVTGAAAAQSTAPAARSIPVYIADFELWATALGSAVPVAPHSQGPAPPRMPQPAASGSASAGPNSPAPPLVYQDSEAPYVQARRLMDFFSATLLQTFQNNGYTAGHQPASRPGQGVLIRGVFAEPDDVNRVRRAILGSASTSPKFMLYVGLFNLSRPDQPLYQTAPVQSPDSRYGPVITLNNYVPLAKYELDKNPTEEDVRRICSQIAGNLTGLLASNASAFAQ